MKINKNVPNILCIIRMALIPFVLLFLLDNGLSLLMPMWVRILVSGLIFGIAMLTDMFDGKIARKYNYITDFGKFIDPIADKMLVLCVLVAFIECDLVSCVPVLIILAREFMITGLRLAAAGKGCVIAANVWGKIKTVLEGVFLGCFYGYMFIFSLAVKEFSSFGAAFDLRFFGLELVAEIGVWVLAAVTVISAIPYFIDGKKYLKTE